MHEIYHISELEKIYEKPRLTSWCTLSPSTMDFTARRCKLRTRRKLQNDAVATSILGWLCEQFPEVFQTHVMPHLTDADLRNLASLGSVPRSAIRTSSRAAAVKSRLEWFVRVPATSALINTLTRLARGWRQFVKALTPCITPEENLDDQTSRQARVDAAEMSIILNDGRLIVYGPIHYMNQRSVTTGRIYPGHILEREVGVYYGRHVIHQRALGELDHPAGTSNTFRSLNAANVSHQILDCHWEGTLLMAYVEILDTPSGRMARDLILAGIEVRGSARGWATLMNWRQEIYVLEDYELITFDLEAAEGIPLQVHPLQRRYENLRPPIDVEQAIASFKRELERDHPLK